MITVSLYDGHYNTEHKLDNDASLSDLLAVLEEYRHMPMELPASALTVEHDDDVRCETCGETGYEHDYYSAEDDGPVECPECRYNTEVDLGIADDDDDDPGPEVYPTYISPFDDEETK
jgi:DNA-directed RNA polymerase subunit RPC12/RpoP